MLAQTLRSVRHCAVRNTLSGAARDPRQDKQRSNESADANTVFSGSIAQLPRSARCHSSKARPAQHLYRGVREICEVERSDAGIV
jgi:hypothetical protein